MSSSSVRRPLGLFLVGLMLVCLAQLSPSPPAAEAVPQAPKVGQATANVGWYDQSKYGIFVHYVPGLTIRRDGTQPSSVDALAAEFNATQFAADANSFGADYVVFTAWHLAMNPLYPSAVHESWRPGQSSDRDLIRDLINALKPYGIRLVLYVHATDGHDFSPTDQALTGWNDPTNGYKKWNDYINQTMTEMGNRYGDDIEGLWVDMVKEANFNEKIDKPRLRASMLAGNPHRVLLGNMGFNFTNDAVNGAPAVDYPATEFSGGAVQGWPTTPNQMAGIATTSSWWTTTAEGTNVMPSSSLDLYRYLILQAAVNKRGGGTAYAFGAYAGLTGSVWETGVKPAMQGVGTYVQTAGDSLRNTRPSAAYPVADGTTLNSLSTGRVALTSQDGTKTFIHVFSAPGGSTITLPATADGTQFSSAINKATGNAITITQSGSAVTLTLTGGDTWSSSDTIIQLANAVPTYPSLRNNDKALTYSGQWGRSSNRNVGDYGNDVEYTTVNGAYFDYTFTGSGVTYIAPRSPQYGDADIYIDGRYFGRYSAFASSYTPQQTIFSTTSLLPSMHTMRVVKVTGDYLQVDALDT
ncbi:alpha-L-fucosidase, partial [Salinibacterium sp.]|uniref:alpha-L-fucosidase n=1 Tax=Salinibacterium sp. TaxID=1915057 RepID=UPI00286CB32A